MADVVVLILQVMDEIHDIAKGIKESDRQASRLSERMEAVEPAVFAIKRGRRGVVLRVTAPALGGLGGHPELSGRVRTNV